MFQNTHKFIKGSAGFAYVLGVILIVTSLVMSTGIVPASAAEPQAGIGNCTNYDAKPPGSGTEVSYSAPAGQIVRKVTIKAGSQNQEDACYGFAFPPAKQDDGCYQVSGLGSDSITAKKIGDGPDCKDISHIEIALDDAPTPTLTNTPEEPTPTPTDTPEGPTPTPTNTPEEPTSTPTDTPEGPTPTPTNTPEEPTPTPTDTPEGPTPTPTNTPEEPTPTNTPVPATETPETTVEPSETTVPTETPTLTATLGTPVKTQAPKEVDPEPTDEPKVKDTATPVPTVPAPNAETVAETDILIPVTGVDLSFQKTQSIKLISNLGYIFFGLGIVLHGISLKTRNDENEF